MADTKGHVNWTIDQSVIDAIKRRAELLTRQNGIKASESAVANALLRERLDELTPKMATVKRPVSEVHYEDVDNE